jgi:cytochrome c biogenesis protein CcmG/thiol:disulfide interchange protein DsbE
VLAVVVLTVGALVVVLGTGIGRDPAVPPAQAVGAPAPALHGPTLEGGTFDLTDHRGNVVLVNVWASWCEPCRREYPALAEAAQGLGPHGLVVVGVNTRDETPDAQAFLADLGGARYPNVDDRAGRVAVDWGVFGVPETFVVDRAGVVRARAVGEVTAEWIEESVRPLLGA